MLLPPFNVSVLAALSAHKNLLCYTNTISDISTTLIQWGKSVLTLEKHNYNSKEINCQVMILPDLNTFSPSDQNSLAKWLVSLKKQKIDFIVIGTISEIHLTYYLKRQFWFLCGKPNGNIKYVDYTRDISSISVHPTIIRYVLDLIVHLRTHRFSNSAFGGGSNINSIDDIILLAKFLAIEENKEFITPDLIQLSVKWYFPLHMKLITKNSEDSSVLYGTDPETIKEILKKLSLFTDKKKEELDNPLLLQLLVLNDVISNVIPNL